MEAPSWTVEAEEIHYIYQIPKNRTDKEQVISCDSVRTFSYGISGPVVHWIIYQLDNSKGFVTTYQDWDLSARTIKPFNKWGLVEDLASSHPARVLAVKRLKVSLTQCEKIEHEQRKLQEQW